MTAARAERVQQLEGVVIDRIVRNVAARHELTDDETAFLGWDLRRALERWRAGSSLADDRWTADPIELAAEIDRFVAHRRNRPVHPKAAIQ